MNDPWSDLEHRLIQLNALTMPMNAAISRARILSAKFDPDRSG